VRTIATLLQFARDLRKPPVGVWNPDALKRIGHIAQFQNESGRREWRRWENLV
jgi:hypothetical protein